MTFDQLAREGAIAAYDAHGDDMPPAAEAWDFLAQVYCERATLPGRMPAPFRHNYERYVRCIAARNPFIMCDVTRTEAK